jgi:hypothetical protein
MGKSIFRFQCSFPFHIRRGITWDKNGTFEVSYIYRQKYLGIQKWKIELLSSLHYFEYIDLVQKILFLCDMILSSVLK